MMIQQDNRRLVCLVWHIGRSKGESKSFLEYRLFYSLKTVECLFNEKNQKIMIGYQNNRFTGLPFLSSFLLCFSL